MTASELPERFDGFRREGLIGEGGMGRVYRGRDELLERPVALKFLSTDEVDALARERLLAEARAIARLSHPNVVAIYRVGEAEGSPYIAYELVDGTSLDRLGEAVSPEVATQIGVGVARGLAAAHRRGVLHRDIKPANVMLTTAGDAKVLDFGVAKVAGKNDPASASRATTADPALTHIGAMVGTPLYFAPELWNGGPASPQTDIFALGLMLHEILVGAHPFARVVATGDLTALRMHMAQGVPGLPATVPEPLARIVHRCVTPDLGIRFRTAAEVRDALESLQRPARSVSTPLAIPPTKYVRNGSVNLAYQTFGAGPVDIILVLGWVTHLELSWQEPHYAEFLRHFGRLGRVVVFDKRGCGLSDRDVEAASLEDRMSDVLAVMDAVDMERAVVVGFSEGAAMCGLFAATYPERTRALVTYGGAGRLAPAPGYPAGMPPEALAGAIELIRAQWGGPIFIEGQAPAYANDEAFRTWWATFLRLGASPEAAIALLEMNFRVDIRDLLATIRVPTLVMHREGDLMMPLAGSKYLADHIPGARFALLPGDEHVPFVGDTDALFGAVEGFLGEIEAPPSAIGSVAATVLALVGVDRLSSSMHAQLVRFGGSELYSTPDDTVSVVAFSGPERAVQCALALVDEAKRTGIDLRVGLHTGDCSTDLGTDGGTATSIARQVMALAESGEVLISDAVYELIPQDALATEPRAATPSCRRVSAPSPGAAVHRRERA